MSDFTDRMFGCERCRRLDAEIEMLRLRVAELEFRENARRELAEEKAAALEGK